MASNCKRLVPSSQAFSLPSVVLIFRAVASPAARRQIASLLASAPKPTSSANYALASAAHRITLFAPICELPLVAGWSGERNGRAAARRYVVPFPTFLFLAATARL
jgi:hypothetical protein